MIAELIHKFSSSANSTPAANPCFTLPQTEMQLPKITIKTFTGKIDEWMPFYQLFKALIGDKVNLSDAQKFMYLKGVVSGEPLKLIENLMVRDDNFAVLLKMIQNRY